MVPMESLHRTTPSTQDEEVDGWEGEECPTLLEGDFPLMAGGTSPWSGRPRQEPQESPQDIRQDIGWLPTASDPHCNKDIFCSCKVQERMPNFILTRCFAIMEALWTCLLV